MLKVLFSQMTALIVPEPVTIQPVIPSLGPLFFMEEPVTPPVDFQLGAIASVS